ncbi:DNA polymerase III subunit gamma/tau [Candidatus Halobeggiatoa sp. HSG11]|nr:DNA polymerase III subunit gamma/tau [Candidatus Halobeggiatoa sp. HSG11]
MAYQVLARKWRPHNFPEMVGQAHVLRALTNALDNDRLHHAYLFTGTRGVGKTTIARILAKSLNCEHGVSAYPCGECATCCEIDTGRFVDLIEVDAASRTKVEDTRDLLDNVQYAPTKGRYKVYLIDEVHMLSTHSFNALLKTLEEPPSHVKFLLATTDPHKLPPTILSRCLQFNLKRIPLEQIIQHLDKIVTAENVEHEKSALNLLSQAADGSLRDALSLLDQAIAYGAGKLATDDVNGMLGSLDQNMVLELVSLLIANEAASLLEKVAILAEQNPDFTTVLGDMLSILQQIALAQIVPETIDKSQPESESIQELAKQLSPEDVQLFYQICLIGKRDLPLAPEPRGGFEMVMLRMLAFRPVTQGTVQNSTTTIKPVAKSTSPIKSTKSAPVTTSEWGNVVQTLGLNGFIKQLANNCELKKHEGNSWHLSLNPQYKAVLNENRKKTLEELLNKHYGESQTVHIRVEEAKTPAMHQQQVHEEHQRYMVKELEKEPFVVYMKENCNAQVKVVTNG